jgi:hypothetical protein
VSGLSVVATGGSPSERLTMWLAAVGLIVLIAGSFGQSGTVRAQSPAIDPVAVVKACVQVVHSSAHSPPYPEYANKNFDAYYDRQSGMFFNNARLNVDQEALYLFDKCMSEHGISLTSK